jgi:hypothetical protein
MTDIFKSIPTKGAIEIDATGPDAVLVLDIENALGETYHFEILNGEKPRRLPGGMVIDALDQKSSLVMTFKVNG